MQTKHVLVIGGTGKTGRKVVSLLQTKGHKVRVGSRSASPSFDWHQPEHWAAALADVDTVYITYQPDLAVPGAKEAVTLLCEKAKEVGVEKLVLLSGRGEEEAQACEQIVADSGLKWAVVRCDWFNQNFSESFFLEPVLAGQVALPMADIPIPFVDTDDIAEVAVELIVRDEFDGQVWELTGPRLLSLRQAVAEIAEETGRDIQFQPISLETYVGFMEQQQIPASYIWLINYLFSQVLDGRNAHLAEGVQQVLGRKPKDFREYARETAASGIWNVGVGV